MNPIANEYLDDAVLKRNRLLVPVEVVADVSFTIDASKSTIYPYRRADTYPATGIGRFARGTRSLGGGRAMGV
jgi:hypothetical protein